MEAAFLFQPKDHMTVTTEAGKPVFAPGQVWRTRGGEERIVRRINNGAGFPVVTVQHPTAVRWPDFFCFTLSGSYYGADGKESPEDLVDLVSGPVVADILVHTWRVSLSYDTLVLNEFGHVMCLASSPEVAVAIVRFQNLAAS